jgi:hypothetical protein
VWLKYSKKYCLSVYSIGRWKNKLKRSELLAFFANYPASIIGIEACESSAHHWARELTKLGHEVILLNARFVKNYVVGNQDRSPLGSVALDVKSAAKAPPPTHAREELDGLGAI